MKRLLIIANRLPIKAKKTKSGINFTPSAGGLATGLNSLNVEYEKHWIGWPGITPRDEKIKSEIEEKLNKDLIHPVFLNPREYSLYYEGFSNTTIWPLFHYFPQFVEYKQETFEVYKKVNEHFRDKVLEIAEPGDIIWVQDYHLMLLPGMLREALPDNEIGFFLHIPFPSYELFRTLPWRKEILHGLLGSDLIGFHTYEYMRHFMSSIYRIMDLEPFLGMVSYKNRSVQVDTFPMGINYEQFSQAREKEAVQKHMRQFKREFGEKKIILSVDRLDYSKGIIHRLKGYDNFLSKNPSYKGKVSLVMVLVPSRDQVEQYQNLKEEIDEAVGHINGKYSTMRWMPINYMYRSMPFDQLSALYSIADIALVTPLRDGMNLVAKEYVASKDNSTGVLILSEMAGAAIELVGAHIVNPNNVEDIANGLKSVLEMPEPEQKHRLKSMQVKLKKQSIQKWANDFINTLDDISSKQQTLEKKAITQRDFNGIIDSYNKGKKRLLLLDYDGTLVPFNDNPKEAFPDDELLEIVGQLAKNDKNTVVIISGRDHHTLGTWWQEQPVEMIAEHGTWFLEDGKWKEVKKISDKWKPEIQNLLQQFVDRTPGSFIEEKPHSVAWHYRKTDAYIGDIRSRELINALIYPCTKGNLEILDGNKVVEIKISGIDKGTATEHWLDKENWDFILAMGDDRTDEDIFRVLPDDAFSIKIGLKESIAKYRIKSYKDVRELLQSLNKSSVSAEVPD